MSKNLSPIKCPSTLHVEQIYEASNETIPEKSEDETTEYEKCETQHINTNAQKTDELPHDKKVAPDLPFHQLKIEKSKNDTRKYKALSLANGLTVLLISDLTSEEANLFHFDEYFDDYYESENDLSDVDYDSDSDDSGRSRERSISPHRRSPKPKRTEQRKRKDAKPKDDASDALDGLSSAAALCVGVGSLHDPDDIPGLAHFLEHMVFMGSAKYPAEDEFDKYITKCGGHANAFTDCERTVFYFDVSRQNFRGALDRFAQFFIFPLLKKESVEKEINAVDSEFLSGIQSDSNRKQQLLSNMARSGHPMRKFMWGNSTTLKTFPQQNGINVYERLKKFREQMYSAPYMTLVVHSKDTIKTLEKWVIESFAHVPNTGKNKASLVCYREPFDQNNFHKLYKVVPVKDINQVEVTWSLPAMLRFFYKEKPMYYITWLVVHGGPRGLLAYLKKHGWAYSIQCFGEHGSYEKNETGCLFTIAIAVTDDGLNHVYNVITSLFEYLEMLRQKGPLKRIFEEIQRIEDNEFRWQEVTEPVEYVKTISEDMHLYSPKHYLTGNALLKEYNPKLIAECLNALKPKMSNIMVVSKSYALGSHCIQREKWYDTRYGIFDIDEKWEKRWENLKPNPAFSYPERNHYISSNFKLVEENERYADTLAPPKLIHETDFCRVWFKQDRFYEVPKGYIYIYVISRVIKISHQTTTLFDFFCLLVGQIMYESVYPAEAANLEYSFDIVDDGLIIKMNGFSHKLPQLFQTIMDFIGSLSISDEHYRIGKERLDRIYHNDCIRPEKLANDLHDAVMIKDYVTIIRRRASLKEITKDMIVKFAHDFRNQIYVEVLVQGNFSESKAMSLFGYIEKKLKNCLPREQVPLPQLVKFPEKVLYLAVKSLNNDDTNSVVTNFYQHGESTIRESVLNELLENVLDEPSFTELRTKEQLGYAVNVKHHDIRSVVTLSVTVETQATKFSVDHVDKKIEEFLQAYSKRLDKMTAQEFEEHVSALVTSKKCDDSNLGEEADRYWSAIERRDYLFDRHELEIRELQKLTLPEFRNWYNNLLLGPNRRKFSVQVMGSTNKAVQTKFKCCPFGFLSGSLREAELSLKTNYKLEFVASTKDHVTDLELLRTNLRVFENITDESPDVNVSSATFDEY